MKENIALDKKDQHSLNISVQKTKKLLKTGKVKVLTKKEHLAKSKRVKGVVYLSCIPHGFYEEQLQKYFSQFGNVTRVRVSRSQRTGKSKGYAFIEFAEATVAEIAAQTMNNYLMDKRLLKAKYIPGDAVRKGLFRGKDFTEKNYPKKRKRADEIAKYNAPKSDLTEKETCTKLNKSIKKIKAKLHELGIEWDFKPVDVPEVIVKTEKDDKKELNDDKKESLEVKLEQKPAKKQKKAEVERQAKVSALKQMKPKASKQVKIKSGIQKKPLNKKRQK